MLRMIRWVCDLLRDLSSLYVGTASMEHALEQARAFPDDYFSTKGITPFEYDVAVRINAEGGDLKAAIERYRRDAAVMQFFPDTNERLLEVFLRWKAEQAQK